MQYACMISGSGQANPALYPQIIRDDCTGPLFATPTTMCWDLSTKKMHFIEEVTHGQLDYGLFVPREMMLQSG